jgi:formylglycine-generating enzyme required for sulfatase activity
MPAGSYPKGVSPYGVFDMSGNVSEWTSSAYEPYPHPEGVLPTDFGGTPGNRPQDEIAPPTIPPPASNVKIKKDDPRLRFFTIEMLQDIRPRVYRGGSYNSYARFLRCAQRQKEDPGSRWQNLGFRCAGRLSEHRRPCLRPLHRQPRLRLHRHQTRPDPGNGAGDAR